VSALELIEAVEQAGGSLQVSGDKLRYSIPREAAHLVPRLREHKPAVIIILKQRGQFTCHRCRSHFDTRIGLAAHEGYGCGNERIARPTADSLPSCPVCGSYALYRLPGGRAECQTCGGTSV
jgi:ribosomal protein L37AE/L43A